MTTAVKTSAPESTANAENAVINSRNGRRPDQDRTTKPTEFGASMPKKDAKPSQISQQNQGVLISLFYQGEDEGEAPKLSEENQSVSSPCQGEDEGEGPNTAKRIKILLLRTPRRSQEFDFSAGSS
jgi:hypothetical protein